MKENDLLPRMVQDHQKIEKLLENLEKEIDRDDIFNAFHRFEWELEKHIFLEEKVIFMQYNPKNINEGYKNFPEITKQHNFILNKLNNWRNDIKKIKNIEDFFNFKKILINHKKFEEEKIYPKLDEILSDEQKNNITDKLDEFIK